MKYLLPVLFGLAATWITGLILLPIEYVILDNFFAPGAWINDMICIVSGCLWVLAGTITGAFAAVQLIDRKEDFVIFLMAATSFLITFLIVKAELFTVPFILPGLVLIIGYSLGGYLGIRSRKKKMPGTQQS